MNRILTIWTLGCWLCSCHGKPGGANHDLSFSVDTAQIKRMDSATAAQRLSDSILLFKAGSSPGVNAGAGNFMINVPRGWRRVDTLFGKISAVILDTPSTLPGFRTNISIVSDSLRGMSVEDYVRGTISSMAQYIPQFVLIGNDKRTINGRPSRWLHYSQNREGTGLENICYFIPEKGIVFILTCSALKGRLLTFRPAFEAAVTSFMVR